MGEYPPQPGGLSAVSDRLRDHWRHLLSCVRVCDVRRAYGRAGRRKCACALSDGRYRVYGVCGGVPAFHQPVPCETPQAGIWAVWCARPFQSACGPHPAAGKRDRPARRPCLRACVRTRVWEAPVPAAAQAHACAAAKRIPPRARGIPCNGGAFPRRIFCKLALQPCAGASCEPHSASAKREARRKGLKACHTHGAHWRGDARRCILFCMDGGKLRHGDGHLLPSGPARHSGHESAFHLRQHCGAPCASGQQEILLQAAKLRFGFGHGSTACGRTLPALRRSASFPRCFS